MVIESRLIELLFGWLPEWFVAPLPLGDVDDYSAGAWSVTLVVYFVLNAVVGPVVEELYFRGSSIRSWQVSGQFAAPNCPGACQPR